MGIQWAIMHRSNGAILQTGNIADDEESAEHVRAELESVLDRVHEVAPEIASSLEVRRLR